MADHRKRYIPDEEELERKIDHLHQLLKDRHELAAATEWEKIIAADNHDRWRIVKLLIALDFELKRHLSKPLDIQKHSAALIKIGREVGRTEWQVNAYLHDFSNVPEVESRHNLGQRIAEVAAELFDIAEQCDKMSAAVVEAFGANPRGRVPLARRLKGDPFENFAYGLALIWIGHHRRIPPERDIDPVWRSALEGPQRRLVGLDRKSFEAILEVASEVMISRTEIPEKLVARIVRRLKSDGITP